MLFNTTFTLQFHNTADITKQMPDIISPAHTQQKVTNLELNNHWWRMWTSSIIAVMWMRNVPNQKVGHWGILEKFFLGHQDIPGKNGTNGNPGNVTSHNSLIALQLSRLPLRETKFWVTAMLMWIHALEILLISRWIVITNYVLSSTEMTKLHWN